MTGAVEAHGTNHLSDSQMQAKGQCCDRYLKYRPVHVKHNREFLRGHTWIAFEFYVLVLFSDGRKIMSGFTVFRQIH